MSQEARILQLIDDAVCRATEPLKARVDELESRLAAFQGSGGASAATGQKRASTGRTARAKAEAADAPEAKPSTGDKAAGGAGDA